MGFSIAHQCPPVIDFVCVAMAGNHTWKGSIGIKFTLSVPKRKLHTFIPQRPIWNGTSYWRTEDNWSNGTATLPSIEKEIKINEYQKLLQIEKEIAGEVPRGDKHWLRKSVDRKAQNQQGVRVLPTGLIYLCFVISRFSQLFITSRSLTLNLLSISISFGTKNNLCWRWEMRNLFCWSHTQTLTAVASEAIHTRTSVTSRQCWHMWRWHDSHECLLHTRPHLKAQSKKKSALIFNNLWQKKSFLWEFCFSEERSLNKNWCVHS